MASYLTVGPVPKRTHADNVVILTEPELVFDLPAVETGFYYL
jgi:hypothetical protein